MQDFARLEVEVKFQLMDHQHGTDATRLPALGWTWNQLDLWRDLEDRLNTEEWHVTPASVQLADRCGENVGLAHQLTCHLRRAASEVQQQALDGPDACAFLVEYRPALLFQTLRAIGYSSLPIFKRLLAVYSASVLSHITMYI